MDLITAAIELLEPADHCEVFLNGTYSLEVLTTSGELKSIDRPRQDAASAEQLQHQLQEFAFAQGVRLDPHFPANGGDFVWPPQQDGREAASARFRWHGVIAPIADDGPFVSIRKHRFDDERLHFAGPRGWQQVTSAAVAEHMPVIICGPTGSGKSSFLSLLLRRHCLEQRTILIENVKELPLMAKSWLRLTTTPPLLDGREGFDSRRLLFESLRMRPENIVLGELRGAEAETFYQAYLTGHGGMFTTIHCDSPEALEKRLDNLCFNTLPAGSWQRLFQLKSPLVVVLAASPAFTVTGLYRYDAEQGWQAVTAAREQVVGSG